MLMPVRLKNLAKIMTVKKDFGEVILIKYILRTWGFIEKVH